MSIIIHSSTPVAYYKLKVLKVVKARMDIKKGRAVGLVGWVEYPESYLISVLVSLEEFDALLKRHRELVNLLSYKILEDCVQVVLQRNPAQSYNYFKDLNVPANFNILFSLVNKSTSFSQDNKLKNARLRVELGQDDIWYEEI